MADVIQIAAAPREVTGKTSHLLAPQGKLPAVVYGMGRSPQPLSVDKHDFELLASHEGLTSSLVHLSIEGHSAPVNVIVKEIQHDPVKGTIRHVDFWAIKMDQRITTTVPIHFDGSSPGVKSGGILNHAMAEVQVEALPADLPDYAVADVSGLEVGDSIHARDLSVPKGVIITSPADDIVCSVIPPLTVEAEELVPAEAAEPEVIGETQEEE